MTSEDFRRQMKEKRELAGLSQNDLGRIIGKHQVQITNWETGKHLPRSENVKKIMTVFGIADQTFRIFRKMKEAQGNGK